jgi:hypothetical protein
LQAAETATTLDHLAPDHISWHGPGLIQFHADPIADSERRKQLSGLDHGTKYPAEHGDVNRVSERLSTAATCSYHFLRMPDLQGGGGIQQAVYGELSELAAPAARQSTIHVTRHGQGSTRTQKTRYS